MFRRFVSTFLSVTAIGIFVGLILGTIPWTTWEEVVWPTLVAVMLISVGMSVVIGALSGFAVMSRPDISPLRTVAKIAGAGFIGFFIGKWIDPGLKPTGINMLCLLLAMVVAAVAIRFQWDQWLTREEAPHESTKPKDIPTDERNADNPT